jgi:predicted Zn-dependent protease
MNQRYLSAVLAVLFLGLAGAFVAMPTLAQTLPSLGDGSNGDFPLQTERKLGEQIMFQIRQDRDYLDDAPILEYLGNFGRMLLDAHPEILAETSYDYFFFAVRDARLNAFALPGGNIGVHSGLLLAAQTESELAGVLAHEIGHVSQRHIARMLGQQRETTLIALASAALAVLASRSSGDASTALLMGGQGLAMQRQLGFSRDAEREADRVGLHIMRDAGFDASGFVSFFNRLQTASRVHSDAVPPFLRSHPMTTERIADIQNRLHGMPYRQRLDSLDFHLIRARVRVLQDSSSRGLGDASRVFDAQLQQKNKMQTAAAKYGLAYVAYRREQYAKAEALLQEAMIAAQARGSGLRSVQSAVFANLAIDIKLGAGQADEGIKLADEARSAFPLSRGIARQYAQALYRAKRFDDAIPYLRDQAQLYPAEKELHDLLAKTYAAQGKDALQHMALAESYALGGSLPAAIEQLNLARRAPDASYYDQAVIDAREREWQAKVREEMKERRRDQR